MRHIYDLEGLMKKTGITDLKELERRGYDVREWLTNRKTEVSQKKFKGTKKKHIYDMDGLMERTGITDYDELERRGYNVQEWLARQKSEESQNEPEVWIGNTRRTRYRDRYSDPSSEFYLGT